MPNTPTSNVDKQRWMSEIPDLDRLRLTELIWPGTHNSGMDKKASNYEVVLGNWTTCQNDSFAWQLANGARAFDLRLGYRTGTPQGTFYFHHNGYTSQRVLGELIDAVNDFSERNPDEFILLDFHQLRDGDQHFDFQQFNDLLVQRLGPRAIAPEDEDKTLGQLKAASNKRRVIIAASGSVELDMAVFWPRIRHYWSGTRLTNASELRQHIARTLDTRRYDDLWSLTATSYSFLGGPVDIKQHINDWFHSSRDWVTRCSVISTDFFDESQIVGYCWVANAMKAVQRRA